MIEETAIVIDVRGQQALLQTQRKSTCHSCSAKSACGTSTLSKVVGQRSSEFVVENTLGARKGDRVIVAVNENALLEGSLMVYLLPLVLMIVAGLFADWLFATEGLTILASVSGFVMAMVFVRYTLLSGRLKKSIQPHLVRRL